MIAFPRRPTGRGGTLSPAPAALKDGTILLLASPAAHAAAFKGFDSAPRGDSDRSAKGSSPGPPFDLVSKSRHRTAVTTDILPQTPRDSFH